MEIRGKGREGERERERRGRSEMQILFPSAVCDYTIDNLLVVLSTSAGERSSRPTRRGSLTIKCRHC